MLTQKADAIADLSDRLTRVEVLLERLVQIQEARTPPATLTQPANTMSATELMDVLNLKPWVFFKHQRAGKFKRFEFKRPIGHKRYSGRLVAAYLEQRVR